MGQITALIHSFDVRLLSHRTSRCAWRASINWISDWRNSRSSSSVSNLKARIFCENFLSDNVLGTPENADPRTSAKPLSAALTLTVPMKLIKKCMPPKMRNICVEQFRVAPYYLTYNLVELLISSVYYPLLSLCICEPLCLQHWCQYCRWTGGLGKNQW